MDHLYLTAIDVHGEHRHGELGRPTLLHHLPFVGGLIQGMALLVAISGDRVGRGSLDIGTREPALVRIHGGYRSTRGQGADLVGFTSLDITPPGSVVLHITNPPLLPSAVCPP